MPRTAHSLFTGSGLAKPARFDRTTNVTMEMDELVVVRPTDPETEPDAIAADQRRDVVRAWRDTPRTLATEERVALVSEEVYLHPWIVRRRLREAGYDVPDVARPPSPKPRIEDVLLAELRRGGKGTTAQLMRRAGLPACNGGWAVKVMQHLCMKHVVYIVARTTYGNGRRTTPVYAVVN